MYVRLVVYTRQRMCDVTMTTWTSVAWFLGLAVAQVSFFDSHRTIAKHLVILLACHNSCVLQINAILHNYHLLRKIASFRQGCWIKMHKKGTLHPTYMYKMRVVQVQNACAPCMCMRTQTCCALFVKCVWSKC